MNTYQTQAAAVTAKRRAAGRYPSKAQIMAGRKLIGMGVKALSKDELLLLASHPDFGTAQKAEYAALAASVNWTAQ